jgi:hypothetical protein
MPGGFIGMPGTQFVSNQTAIAIGPSGKPIRVYDAYAISDGTATTVKLYNGTSATGNYLQIDGIISKSSQLPLSSDQGFLFPLGCFASVDSHTVMLAVSFVQEL